MNRSKKIFKAVAIVFFLFLMYVVYDISTRTTFPGSKPAGQDTLKALPPAGDSLDADTAR